MPKTRKMLGKKRGSRLAYAAVACMAAAALVVGGTAGYALSGAGSPQNEQSGKAIPTQVVNSSHTQEQVSVSARNAVDTYSWEELATISDAIAVAKNEEDALKIAKDFNLVGASGKLDGTQTKSVRMNNGDVVQAQIIGFAHDTRDGGGKAGITFMFKDCIAQHQLNASNSTGGGWLYSDLRNWMNDDLFYSLPGDLRGSIVSVCKSANNAGKTSSRADVTLASDLLWAPSFTELVGYVDRDSYEDAYERIPASRVSEFQTYFDIWNAEGFQYKLYRDSKVKMAKSNSVLTKALPSGAVSSWWGRSASPGEWDRALSISSKGKVQKSTSAPSEWLGVAPCFCIGRFGCGEARDKVPAYVDDSVTYVNPVDVNYVYVNDDDSSTINVTYVDKSTNTTNITNNQTTNNVDNSVNVDADVDTSVDVGDEYQVNPVVGEEPNDQQQGEEGSGDEDNAGGALEGQGDESEQDASDDEGEAGGEGAGEGNAWDNGADVPADDASESDDVGEPNFGNDHDPESADESDDADEPDDADGDSGEDDGRDGEDDKSAAANSGEQQTLTGIVEVRRAGDHDAVMLVLPSSVTVNDSENGSATSNLIGLDSSFGRYSGKQVTIRCTLRVNPDGQTAPNGSTRIYAKGDAEVVNVAGANGGSQAAPDKSDDPDSEDAVVEAPILSTSSDVQGAIDKVLDGELPFGL